MGEEAVSMTSGRDCGGLFAIRHSCAARQSVDQRSPGGRTDVPGRIAIERTLPPPSSSPSRLVQVPHRNAATGSGGRCQLGRGCDPKLEFPSFQNIDCRPAVRFSETSQAEQHSTAQHARSRRSRENPLVRPALQPCGSEPTVRSKPHDALKGHVVCTRDSCVRQRSDGDDDAKLPDYGKCQYTST